MKKIKEFFIKLNSNILAILLIVAGVVAYLPIRIIYPTKIIGKKNLKTTKKEGGLVTPNHFANFDVIFFDVLFFKNTYKRKFLAKKELGEKRFQNFALKSFGAIYIDRGVADRQAMREVVSNLKEKKTVILFPEGTRNKTESSDMLELKSGVVFFAKRADCYITPIRMEHKAKPFRKNKIIVGEPYKVEEGSKIDDEVLRLEEKFKEMGDSLNLA